MNNKGASLLDFPNSYVVLDIETTGLRAEECEIIEVAAIKIVNNKVVGEYEELIRPYNTVNGQIISLTKITNSMLKNKRRFSEVGQDFKKFIGDSIIVAHNANFDVNFIIHHFKNNGLGKFSNDFIDTLRLARLAVKGTKDHRLETLLDYFGIEQIDSHRAMIDVVNTHKLYIELKQLNDKDPDFFKPRGRNDFYGRTDLTEISMETSTDAIDKENIFYNKKVCFTCDLLDFVKEDVAQTIVNLGGEIQKGVTLKTDILILGDLKSQIDRYGKESSKHLKALDYIERGQEIQILEEPGLKEIIYGLDNKVDDVNEKEIPTEIISNIISKDIEQDNIQESLPSNKRNSQLSSKNFFWVGIISFIFLFFLNANSFPFIFLSLIFLISLPTSLILKIRDIINSYKANN